MTLPLLALIIMLSAGIVISLAICFGIDWLGELCMAVIYLDIAFAISLLILKISHLITL